MKNKSINQIKIDGIANSYVSYREAGYSHDDAEAAVRKLASETADSYQIAAGIKRGQKLAK